MTIKLNPPYDNAYYSRGMLYDKQGDVAAALKDYNKAIELNPSNGYAYNSRYALLTSIDLVGSLSAQCYTFCYWVPISIAWPSVLDL